MPENTTANTEPIYPGKPSNKWCTLSSHNTTKTGTGTVGVAFEARDEAQGGEGARLDTLIIKPLGNNVASVLRVFLNNGGSNDTVTNNSMITEVTLPAITTASETAALPDIVVKFDNDDRPQIVMPPGSKVLVVLGTAVASGYQVTGLGGEY